jgi:hypothetical protein
VTTKVVDEIVAQFMASLNVALSTWLTGTPVAAFVGTVAVIVSGAGGAIVAKVQV